MRAQSPRSSRSSPRSSVPAAIHPAATLQRQIGNRAFGQVVQRACGCGCAGAKGGCGGSSAVDEPEVQRVVAQRAKIDHRTVTWDDFTGGSPGTYPAVTASGIVAPPATPKLTKEATDTEAGCGKGKQTTWDATVAVDPETFAKVKGYMDQGKSGATKAYKAGTPGVDAAVKDCKKSFKDQDPGIAKDASTATAEQTKACKEAFKDGQTEFSLDFDGTEVKAKKVGECATSFAKEVKKQTIASATYGSFSYTYGTGDTPKGCDPFAPSITGSATADAKADCDGSYKEEITALGGQESARLLAHEQVHFNISEAKAGKLKTDLESSVGSMSSSGSGCGKAAANKAADADFAKLKAGAELAKLVKAAKTDLSDTQKSYDAATCHGLDQTNQDTWSGEYP